MRGREMERVMSIEQWDEGILVVKLESEPAFTESMVALREQLEGQASHVVLDMAGVVLLNSSNIAQMLRLRKAQEDQGQRLRLASVGDGVWSVMAIAGLDRIFEFSEDVATALASVQLGRGTRRNDE
jgi:anti-anti-sigma factor